MNKRESVRTAIAAGVAGIGLSIGAVAMATAGQSPTTEVVTAAEPGDRGARHDHLAEQLAGALGLSEEKVSAALEAVHDELGPQRAEARADGVRREPPTEEERDARQAELATALAEELGISVAKVTAALDELHDERRAEGRTMLSERLDAAVEDGDLSAADKASVLKAYDAGVLGRPGFGGPGFGGPGGHVGPRGH